MAYPFRDHFFTGPTPMYHSGLHSFFHYPTQANVNTCHHSFMLLHNLGVYTNGYSICVCHLKCVLKHGGVQECYTGSATVSRAGMCSPRGPNSFIFMHNIITK